MNCRQFGKRIDRYIDRELSKAEYQAAKEHLANCPDCLAAVQQLEDLAVDLSTLSVTEPPLSMVADIVSAVDQPAPAGPLGSWLLWPAAAAASIAAVALGYMVGVSAMGSPAERQATVSVPAPVAELRLEEPFTLFPDAEDTMILLAFSDEAGAQP